MWICVWANVFFKHILKFIKVLIFHIKCSEFGFHPELNWLEQVARVRSTSHMHSISYKMQRVCIFQQLTEVPVWMKFIIIWNFIYLKVPDLICYFHLRNTEWNQFLFSENWKIFWPQWSYAGLWTWRAGGRIFKMMKETGWEECGHHQEQKTVSG